MSEPRLSDAAVREALCQLPAVHRILAHPVIAEAAGTVPAGVMAAAAREAIEAARKELLSGAPRPECTDTDAIAEAALRNARLRIQPTLRAAVNATGVVLHTGLGRARLAAAAVEAMAEVAARHSVLEVDPESGRRGSRRDHVRDLLMELTGAEDAAVVNNCAGAVFLAVAATAAGREVIISRGELVEIGGAFRMPDIIRASGGVLVEVGTTNRTRVADYRAAITDRTGLILRCQPSNFAVVGFTEETPTEELAQLGADAGIPVMDDQGSGAVLPPESFGLPSSKGSLAGSVSSGCDIVTASGDKLLGGPQAGLVLGRSQHIARIVSHPLARALRIDKLTLAALEATLRLYRDPARALTDIPTLRYLNRRLPELTVTAEHLHARLAAALGDRFAVTCVTEMSQVGGGSLPGEALPTVCVSVAADAPAISAELIASRLRTYHVPIFARVKSDAVLLDVRTLDDDDLEHIVAAAQALA